MSVFVFYILKSFKTASTKALILSYTNKDKCGRLKQTFEVLLPTPTVTLKNAHIIWYFYERHRIMSVTWLELRTFK